MSTPNLDAPLLEKVRAVLGFAYGGEHHIPGKIRENASYIEINVPDRLSTYDFDRLTRLVIACHQACVRMEIVASGPRLLKLRFHQRTKRDGRMWERHPDMLTALKDLWPSEPRTLNSELSNDRGASEDTTT